MLRTRETIHVDTEAVDVTIIKVDIGSLESPLQMATVALEGSEEIWFNLFCLRPSTKGTTSSSPAREGNV